MSSTNNNLSAEVRIIMAEIFSNFAKNLSAPTATETTIDAEPSNPPATPAPIQKEKSLELIVSETIQAFGIPAHIKGYRYVREAIILAVNDPDIINHVTKTLYPAVAETYRTTPNRVERAIRHAIEVAWDRGDITILQSYFSYTISPERGRPTNSEFISMISDKITLAHKTA